MAPASAPPSLESVPLYYAADRPATPRGALAWPLAGLLGAAVVCWGVLAREASTQRYAALARPTLVPSATALATAPPRPAPLATPADSILLNTGLLYNGHSQTSPSLQASSPAGPVLGGVAMTVGFIALVRWCVARVVAAATAASGNPEVAMAAVVGIAADRSVKYLLEKHCFAINELASRTTDVRDPAKYDNIWLMRFAAANDGDIDAAEQDVREAIAWREGEGKYIVEAATRAIAEATTIPDSWSNAPIMAAAPYSAIISKYITPSQVLTISLQDTQGSPETNDNDLVYVIRASAINDKDLMQQLSVEQCVQFFLYAKEITYQVADRRTRQSGRLVTVITANDLQGINLFGDATFRKVLSQASKRAVRIYPLLAGPTLLLNLPRILGALIKVFKPLFPKSVQEKLKFQQGPLKDIKDLADLLKPEVREKFLAEIQTALL
eukprot:EG_transcript_9401